MDLQNTTSPAWDARYPASWQNRGYPLTDGLLSDRFEAARINTPSAVAIRYFDRVIEFSEVGEMSDAVSAWLAEQGVVPGDRVGLALQNMPQFMVVVLAVWRLGAIPVPTNPMYLSPEFARQFVDSQPKVMFCEQERGDIVLAALAAAGVVVPLVTTSARDFQSINDKRVLPEPVSIVPEAIDFLSILDRFRGRRAPRYLSSGEGIGLLLYTSGTTGTPKGAMIPHSALKFNASVMRDWFELGQQDRILAIAPMFHITGFACHLSLAIEVGCSIVLGYRLQPAATLDLIRLHRPSFTIGAITAFNALVDESRAPEMDFASFRSLFSGGAPIPPALRTRLGEAMGKPIHTCYGMTETTAPTHFSPLGADIPVDPESGSMSVGIPIPCTDVSVRDDAGTPVPYGTIGEVWIKGPQLMAGYWKKDAETTETIVDGWLRSNDIGVMRQDGWLWLIDRKKDVIIASGFKVWPREVEDVLYLCNDVREAAVVGVPDSYRGETVVAYVTLRPNAISTGDTLIAHCRNHLTGYKCPRLIETLDEMPKTISGKIKRFELRKKTPPQ